MEWAAEVDKDFIIIINWTINKHSWWRKYYQSKFKITPNMNVNFNSIHEST